jgi:hypothetical protein
MQIYLAEFDKNEILIHKNSHRFLDNQALFYLKDHHDAMRLLPGFKINQT